jgi:5-methylcytosine-specific restriction endonuclease McrA
MTNYVSALLRRQVATRALGLCEYCLIHEEDTFFGCQIEHVIARKHGGKTVAENLAYACLYCNAYKGSDIASIAPRSGEIVRLYNPRTDGWSNHFELEALDHLIRAKSEIGEVTVQLLQLNHPDRLLERESLRAIRRYPAPQAKILIAQPNP